MGWCMAFDLYDWLTGYLTGPFRRRLKASRCSIVGAYCSSSSGIIITVKSFSSLFYTRLRVLISFRHRGVEK